MEKRGNRIRDKDEEKKGVGCATERRRGIREKRKKKEKSER